MDENKFLTICKIFLSVSVISLFENTLNVFFNSEIIDNIIIVLNIISMILCFSALIMFFKINKKNNNNDK